MGGTPEGNRKILRIRSAHKKESSAPPRKTEPHSDPNCHHSHGITWPDRHEVVETN